jgi:hypothetical protein
VRASEQHRPDVAERREAWRRGQKSLNGRLIFLDETWTTTAMTPRYGWAEVGTRAFGHAPNGHWPGMKDFAWHWYWRDAPDRKDVRGSASSLEEAMADFRNAWDDADPLRHPRASGRV